MDYFNLFYNISRINHSDCIFNYFNLQKFKEVYTLYKKFYYQLVARFFHVYCTQPLHISVMYVGQLVVVTSLVDMCIAYGNLLQITGRLYTYTVYNVIRISCQ
jgi:hypothetical protein